MREEDAAEIRSRTIRLVLEVLCIGDSTGREYLLMHLCNWYQTEKLWRDSIEAALDDMVSFFNTCYTPFTSHPCTDSSI